MRNGEEKYLLPRDKGPVRRFIRDFVDSRFSFIELIIPLLVVTMVLGYSGNATLADAGNAVLFGSILLVVPRHGGAAASGCAASSPPGSPTSRPRARPTTPSPARCR